MGVPPKTEFVYKDEAAETALDLLKQFPLRVLQRFPACPTVMVGIVPDTIDPDLIERIGKTPASLISFSNLKHFTNAERLEILGYYKQALENMIAFIQIQDKQQKGED